MPRQEDHVQTPPEGAGEPVAAVEWPARVAWFQAAGPPSSRGELAPETRSAWRSAGLEPLSLRLPEGAEERLMLAEAVAGSCRALVLPGADDSTQALADAIGAQTERAVVLLPWARRVQAAAEALARLAAHEEGAPEPVVGLIGPEAEAVGQLLLRDEERGPGQGASDPTAHGLTAVSGGGLTAAQLRRATPPPARPGAPPAARPAAPDPASLLRGPTGGAASTLSLLLVEHDDPDALPEALREVPRLAVGAPEGSAKQDGHAAGGPPAGGPPAGAPTDGAPPVGGPTEGAPADGAALVLPALVRAAIDLGAPLDVAALRRAARALAGLARQDQSEVALPDPRVARVLPTLIEALSGELPADYRRALADRRWPLRRALRGALERARQAPPVLVFVDGEDPRSIAAAAALAEDGLCVPWLLGDSFRVEARAKQEGIALEHVRAVDPKRDKRRAAFAEVLARVLGPRTGLTTARAGELVTTPLLFAGVASLQGEVQALLLPEGEGLRALGPLAELLPRSAPHGALSGTHLLATPEGPLLAVADTAGRSDPTAEELADAAQAAATLLGALLAPAAPAEGPAPPPRVPGVALLSFTDLAPGDDPAAERIALARDLLRARDPRSSVGGPLRAATALDADALRQHPGAGLSGPAQVLVLADRAGALSLVGSLSKLADAQALGPFVGGLTSALAITPPGADAATVELLGALLCARAAALPTAPAADGAPRATGEEAPRPATGAGTPGTTARHAPTPTPAARTRPPTAAPARETSRSEARPVPARPAARPEPAKPEPARAPGVAAPRPEPATPPRAGAAPRPGDPTR